MICFLNSQNSVNLKKEMKWSVAASGKKLLIKQQFSSFCWETEIYCHLKESCEAIRI